MKAAQVFSLSLVLIACRTLGAGSASGFVVGWGDSGAGEATGIPTMVLSNGGFAISGSLFATGTVTVAGKLLSDAVAVAAGKSHGMALLSDGTVVGWGDNSASQAVGFQTPYPYRANGTVRVGSAVLSNVTAITAGRTHSMALTHDGTLVAWGFDPQNPTDLPPGLTNVTAVSAGWGYGMALRKNGTVEAWHGVNSPPFGLSNVVAIAAGGEFGCNLALKSNGTVVEWPVRGVDYVSIVPEGLSNVIAIATRGGQRLALRGNGTVVGWGSNGGGQATGTPTEQSPYESSGMVRIGGQVLSNAVAIAAGDGYSLALKHDGTIVAWGRMSNGLRPVTVPAGLSNVVAIAAGDNFCLAITTDASVAERFGR